MKAPANSSREATALAVAAACLLLVHVDRLESQEALLLRPDRVIDGTGEVLEGASVLVRSGRIERVVAPRRDGAATDMPPEDALEVDLRGATLLPGLIDTHVHLDWYFDDHDRLRTEASGDGVEEQVLHALENAWRMLQAGVTTVQSLGSPLDRAVREALGRGVLPGPRVLTSLDAITEETGDAEAIRARVRALHQDGADVIKVFGSASIRDGGGPTLSQEQLDAACGEAKRLGLRAAVHAHGPESARRAANAGCTTIEHGALLDRATLELLGSRGLFYDPNIDLIFRNYFENEQRYLGIGNYTAEGFAQMRLAQPKALATFRTALEVPGLQIVFGTDAVAGAHGRNVEELVYRIVEGGQDPQRAILSATSVAARSLGLADRIGSVLPGYEADLLAVEGNPLTDPRALLRPVLVMRAGRIVSDGQTMRSASSSFPPQRHPRIDPSRTARRHRAGDRGDREQETGQQRVGQRVGGAHLPEQAAQEACQHQGERDTEDHTGSGKRQATAEHLQEDVALPGAERHAQTQLRELLVHGVRQHAIDADRG